MRGEQRRFPNFTFLAFTVAAKGIDGMGISVHLFAERQPRGRRKPLAQGAGSPVHARKAVRHGRMPLQAAAETTQRPQFGNGEIPCPGEHRIVQRRQVPGGKKEGVLSCSAARPRSGTMFHHIEIEGGKNIRTAQRAARMTGPRSRNHPDDVPTHLRGDSGEFPIRFHTPQK